MSGAEIEIGREQIALLTHKLTLSVEPNLSVRIRIRIRDIDGKLLADIATTAIRALNLAELFKQAAERADPSLVMRQKDESVA